MCPYLSSNPQPVDIISEYRHSSRTSLAEHKDWKNPPPANSKFPKCQMFLVIYVCVCVWVCPHIVLQTGSSPQAGVSLPTESCLELLPQPVNTHHTFLWHTSKKHWIWLPLSSSVFLCEPQHNHTALHSGWFIKYCNSRYHLLASASAPVTSLQHWPPVRCRPCCGCVWCGTLGCWPYPAVQWLGYGSAAVSQTDAEGRNK